MGTGDQSDDTSNPGEVWVGGGGVVAVEKVRGGWYRI